MFDAKLLKDLEFLTEFSHTGSLEVYHALLNKYCPKSRHFSYAGMLCRCQLAALDHNAGAGLSQAIKKDGTRRYNVVYTKQSKMWVAKPIKTHKNKQYALEMVDRAVDMCAGKISVPPLKVPSLPPNIASTPRPVKSTVIESHRSRFKSSN